MKIKVCGITRLDQLIELDTIGIDYAGMIFYRQSSRFVLDKLKSKAVREVSLSLKKVGVFVNAAEEDILTQVELYGLDIVQLHGDETPAFCSHISNHVKVIKAFHLTPKNEQNIDWMLRPFEESCDYYLFDTSVAGKYGGSGEKFSWPILNNNIIHKPFFLSGGLAPLDVNTIREFQHPFLFGIDINSKFEVDAGVKDVSAVKQFKQELQQ